MLGTAGGHVMHSALFFSVCSSLGAVRGGFFFSFEFWGWAWATGRRVSTLFFLLLGSPLHSTLLYYFFFLLVL